MMRCPECLTPLYGVPEVGRYVDYVRSVTYTCNCGYQHIRVDQRAAEKTPTPWSELAAVILRSILKQRLNEALAQHIEAENYELAAVVREKIRELDEAGEAGVDA